MSKFLQKGFLVFAILGQLVAISLAWSQNNPANAITPILGSPIIVYQLFKRQSDE